MNLADVQKTKLIEQLKKEATSRGIALTKFEIYDALEVFYKGREKGQPTCMPFIQAPRSSFNIDGYNEFVLQTSFDVDVLLSFISRARLKARDLMVKNDVSLRGFNKRIEKVNNEVKSFEDSPQESNQFIFEKSFSLPTSEFDILFPEENKACSIEQGYNNLTLGEVGNLSKEIDLTDATRSGSKFEVIENPTAIVRKETASSIGSIARTDAVPWMEKIVISGSSSLLTGALVIELPVLEDCNKLTFECLPGSLGNYTIYTSSVGDNFIFLGNYKKVRTGRSITFAPRKIKKLKIEIEAPVSGNENANSVFVMGLRSLKMSRKVYKNDCSVVVKDIDPEIDNRPILSINMKEDIDLPSGTTAQYFVALNGEDRMSPSLEINGESTEDSSVEFNIAKDLEVELGELGRSGYTERNSLGFEKLVLKNKFGTPMKFDGKNNFYLPRAAEFWTEQNAFKELEMDDTATIEVQDAFVEFSSLNKTQSLFVPLTLDRVPIRTEGSLTFIKLPMSIAAMSVAPEGSETAVDRMKQGNIYGLYKVEAYKSTDTTRSVDITSMCMPVSTNKVAVSGYSPAEDDLFRVTYLGSMGQEAFVKQESVKAHRKFGKEGVLDSSQIHRTDNTYTFSDRNQVALTDKGGDLLALNERIYFDFTMIVDIPRLSLYETYVTVEDFVGKLTLTEPLYADGQAGEYVTLRRVETGDLIRLEGQQVFTNLEKGRYLLSVMSKPKSNQRTAIESVIQATAQSNLSQASLYKVFDVRSSEIITQISVSETPMQYRELTSLLNKSKRVGENTFSTAVVNGELEFISPEKGYKVLNIGGEELYKIRLKYFDKNLFGEDVHSRINIKIRLTSNEAGTTTLTPNIHGLQFKVQYI